MPCGNIDDQMITFHADGRSPAGPQIERTARGGQRDPTLPVTVVYEADM